MITPAYAQLMAAYNAEMNRRWYAAAATLTDDQRRQDFGAFWGSLHGTLNHLLWGDRIWMSRFADWPRPDKGMKQSATLIEDFAALRQAREQADAALRTWAETLDPAWLEQDMVWFSNTANRELQRPRALLVAHLFNHQAHHRGQAHALLTRLGADPGDTDLPVMAVLP